VTPTTTAAESRVAMPGGEINLLRGGDGPPLLFLHGGGGAGAWSPLHEALSRHFDVIAPDHPRMGRSDDFESFGAIDDLVLHYDDLLDELDIPSATVVGASFGAWLAAELAVLAPARVEQLVLMAPIGLRLPDHPVTGYEPHPEQLGWVAPVYVGETDKKAVEEARGPIEWYFRKSLRQPPGAGLPPGYMSTESLRTALTKGRVPSFDHSIEELIAGGYIIVGSPSTVAERIHELQETLGFGQLGANIPVGTVSRQQTRESTDAFAKEVIPLFRERTAPVAG
jgi:pimeloyl-ACP methyl ester carboxylesterase